MKSEGFDEKGQSKEAINISRLKKGGYKTLRRKGTFLEFTVTLFKGHHS